MIGLLLGSLAVYKAVQLLDILVSPRQIYPQWKILIVVLVCIPLALVFDMPQPAISGFAMATVAGMWHTVIRLVYLGGDAARAYVVRNIGKR